MVRRADKGDGENRKKTPNRDGSKAGEKLPGKI